MESLKFLGRAVVFILCFIMCFFIVIIGLGSQEEALQDYRYSNVYVWQSADLPPESKNVFMVNYIDSFNSKNHLQVELYKESNIDYILQSKAPISPMLIQKVPLNSTNIPFSETQSRNFVLQDIKLLSANDVEGKTIYYFLKGQVFNTDFDVAQNDKLIKTEILPTDTKQVNKIYLYVLMSLSTLLAIISVLFCANTIKQRNNWSKLILSCIIMMTISCLMVGYGAIKTLWAIR